MELKCFNSFQNESKGQETIRTSPDHIVNYQTQKCRVAYTEKRVITSMEWLPWPLKTQISFFFFLNSQMPVSDPHWIPEPLKALAAHILKIVTIKIDGNEPCFR